MTSIPLVKWNEWLWAEIFDDQEGDGRPVSIIHVDDDLFARASSRGGLSLSPGEARSRFLDAFPDRLQIQRWLVGSSHPGNAMLPLLILCCLAASEAAESDANDYRARMRDLMGWDERIIHCEGLPRLWAALESQARDRSKSIPTRRLILPDPRYRVQIGHAIELTFPSRNDARKLLTALGSGGFDLDSPRAVIEWLNPIVARGRFSPSFDQTFASFRNAWLDAERALADHRFWSGWKLTTQRLRQAAETSPFEIASDEWGHRHLVAPPDDEPFDLERAIRSQALPGSLLSAATRSHVIPLKEAEWGRLRWTGAAPTVVMPDAMLIRERAFLYRLDQFELSAVTGADGWGLTFKVAAVLGERQLEKIDRDRLIEATPTGVTRVDGGILCRPTLPFFIEVRGYVADVSVDGPLSSSIEIERLEATRWRLTPTLPLEGDVSLVVEPSDGTGKLIRILRLRRSALTPTFRRAAPDRLIEIDTHQNWPADAGATAAIADLVAESEGLPGPAPGLLDLIEYLAIRTAPIPRAAIVKIVNQIAGEGGPNAWDLIRSLADAGLVRTFRARGWPGRTLMAAAPRGVLLRIGPNWGLALEGVLNETTIRRLEAAAHRLGLNVQKRPGVSTWSPETMVILDEREDQLREFASQVDLAVQNLHGTLAGAPPLVGQPVTAPRSAIRRRVTLSDRHAPLFFHDSDRDNQSPVWEVDHGGSAKFWRSREDAVLDAYLAVGERPFMVRDGILSSANARLPSPIARWIRLCSGRAGGPLADGRYGYAINSRIEEALRGYAPGLILRGPTAKPRPAGSRMVPISRSKPPLVAIRAGEGRGFRELWRLVREDK